MTTGKIGPRCTAEYLPEARPVLAADASARLAARPVPSRDWRCVREPHSPATRHLAMPAGVTGQSFGFDGLLVDRHTCPTCPPPGTPRTDGRCPDCGIDYVVLAASWPTPGILSGPSPVGHRERPAPEPEPAPNRADPDDVRRLIELVQQPGSTAVHVNDGDELLLLLPEADDTAVQRSAQALADLFPTVSFLILAGVTGAVVMPRRAEPTYDELIVQRDRLIMQGVDPDQLTMPVRRLNVDDDQA